MTFEKFMRNYISICTNILVVFFNFNFLPFPFSDISPVIARSCWTGLPIASDSVAVTIAHPALGPSCSKNVFFYFWHIMIVELDNTTNAKIRRESMTYLWCCSFRYVEMNRVVVQELVSWIRICFKEGLWKEILYFRKYINN